MAAVRFEGQDEVMGVLSAWAFGFSRQRPGGVPAAPERLAAASATKWDGRWCSR